MKEHFKKAIQYVRDNKTWRGYAEEEALNYMNEMRCGIVRADHDICEEIADLMEEYGEDNDLPEGWWLEIGNEDDVFFEVINNE